MAIKEIQVAIYEKPADIRAWAESEFGAPSEADEELGEPSETVLIDFE